MIERERIFLRTEMGQFHQTLMKLTTEERKREVRRQMHVELRVMEMERRERVALETMLKMRQEANQREEEEEEEEEERVSELEALEKTKQDKLEKESLQWSKEEEQVKWPKFTIDDLKKEQQRRREEAELCRLPEVGDHASPECLTLDLKAKEPLKKRTLHNNWVGEQKMDSEPVKERCHRNSATYRLFAAKPGPKPIEKHKETLQRLPDRITFGYWVDKYLDHRERKVEKRTIKAEEQYAKWTTFKASSARQYDYYTGGFVSDRNRILKSLF